MKAHILLSCAISLSLLAVTEVKGQSLSREKARMAMLNAIAFYRAQVGYRGAYLWRYSADLTRREGEGKATRTSGWTQPPGSPSVGEGYLEAWRLSGEKVCLEAATEVAMALVQSQLESGGWAAHFDLGPEGAKRYAYRRNATQRGKRNYTTFDDDKSQSALMLLMHVDEALKMKDQKVHEAVEYALLKMLQAQYPNGAWPQQFSHSPDPKKYPVKKASYPKSWSRTWPRKDYRGYYTLNDNNMSRIIDMLLEAHRIYGCKDCFEAVEKTGDFFLLAQMPEPQPGWAQQYDLEMHPAWARKFEPPAITGGESQAVLRSLLQLYQCTGKKKFLEAISKAMKYYKKSKLPGGRMARFYELRTNRPLYFTKDYKLTYRDDDLPTHYGFKVGSKITSIERDYQRLKKLDPKDLKPTHKVTRPAKLTSSVRKRAQAAIAAMSSCGAWSEPGKLRDQGKEDSTTHVIEMRTFIRNLEAIARFVGAK